MDWNLNTTCGARAGVASLGTIFNVCEFDPFKMLRKNVRLESSTSDSP